MIVWFRWAFEDKPVRLAEPAWVRDLPGGTPATMRDGRVDLPDSTPACGFGCRIFRAKPQRKVAELIALRDAGSSSPTDDLWILVAIRRLVLSEAIMEHNFTGQDGSPLPVGDGFVEAIIQNDPLCTAVCRALGITWGALRGRVDIRRWRN